MVGNSDPEIRSFGAILGTLVGLIAKEVGAAVAIVGGLWAGFACLNRAEHLLIPEWPLYLVSGGIFIAVLTCCRWRTRG